MDNFFKRMPSHVWVDIHAVKRETGAAVLAETAAGEVWIPKSQMRARKKDEHGQIVRLELPRWIAAEKGLIDDRDCR